MPALNLKEMAQAKAKNYPAPKKRTYLGLAPADVAEIAADAGVYGYEVEIAALEAGIWPQRYVRNYNSFSIGEQVALLRAHAVVVGLGGLGGLLVALLARMGVGRLTLVDFDRFDATNLNRQMLSSMAVLGESKARTALQYVRSVNPSVHAEIFERAFDDSSENLTLLQNKTICADCLDNLKTRMELARACDKAGIPLVSASIGGFCGQLTVVHPGGEGLEAVYGLLDEGSNCEDSKGCEVDMGTPGPTAATVASLQALEVAKVVVRKDTALKNSVVLFDFLSFNMQIIDL